MADVQFVIKGAQNATEEASFRATECATRMAIYPEVNDIVGDRTHNLLGSVWLVLSETVDG